MAACWAASLDPLTVFSLSRIVVLLCNTTEEQVAPKFVSNKHEVISMCRSFVTSQKSCSAVSLPHLLLGLVKAVRDKVNVLECGDETFLLAGGLGVKGPHTGLI